MIVSLVTKASIQLQCCDHKNYRATDKDIVETFSRPLSRITVELVIDYSPLLGKTKLFLVFFFGKRKVFLIGTEWFYINDRIVCPSYLHREKRRW